MSDAAAVLVDFHSGGLVADRARDLIAWGHEVVIVDNGGDYDGPGRVLRPGANLGFGAACNRGVEATSDHVKVILLVNPDASPSREDIARLVRWVVECDWVAVAPAISAGRLRPNGFAVPGRFRELALAPLDVLRLYSRDARTGTRRSALGSVARTEPIRAEGRFATCATIAIAKESFTAIGGFDEAYFLYVEDLDLWGRLAEQGPVGFDPSIVVEHDAATGSVGSSHRRTVLRWLGREIYAESARSSWWFERLIHRIASHAITRDGDPIVVTVLEGFRSGVSPRALGGRVRGVASGAVPDLTYRRRKSLPGWAKRRSSG